MNVELITERDDLLIRRLVLEPDESMYWHIDLCNRFTVVVQGERLAIEYRDGGGRHEFAVYPGSAGWDAPDDRVHRAVNVGTAPYEEVVTFYRSSAGVEPQPRCDGSAP